MSAIDSEVLRVITEHGGKLEYQALVASLGFTSDYVSAVCRSLGNAGYIDFADPKVCVLTPKGREALIRGGWLNEKQLGEIETKSALEMKLQTKKKPEEFFARRTKEEAKSSSAPKPQIKRSPEELFARRASEQAKDSSTPQPKLRGKAYP